MIICDDDTINSASDIQRISSLVKLDPNPAIQSRTLTAEVSSSSCLFSNPPKLTG